MNPSVIFSDEWFCNDLIILGDDLIVDKNIYKEPAEATHFKK